MDWLGGIFCSLPTELSKELQAAWLATMVIRWRNMRCALDSQHNRIRRAAAATFCMGMTNLQVSTPHPKGFSLING
jgi:hypothetical protein